jgi:hypothetical protein
MTDPPSLPSGAVYGEYLPWLLENFYDRLCGYCLLTHLSLSVDHFVPQSFDPSLVNDPSNLLPACSTCNRGKSDYHPQHAGRKRLPTAKHGYLPIDVRNEDFATFYRLEPNGELKTRSANSAERAGWHATGLLKLHLEPFRTRREAICNFAAKCDALLACGAPYEEIADCLELLVTELAKAWPLLSALDYPVSNALRERIIARRRELLAP